MSSTVSVIKERNPENEVCELGTLVETVRRQVETHRDRKVILVR